MKKTFFNIFLPLVIIFLCAPSLSIYASNVDTAAAKEILYKQSDLLKTDNAQDGKAAPDKLELNGVDDKNEIKTFDDKKVFSGVAENGTDITATVYIPADDSNWKELKSYSTSVGASGIFNITIDFNLGENIVVVKATKGTQISQRKFTVKRKDSEIRDKLKEQPASAQIKLK